MSTFGMAGVVLCRTAAVNVFAAGETAKLVSIVEFSGVGVKVGVKDLPKLVKPESEWRRQLAPLSFEVARHADTERPFTGATWNLHDKGLYRCICCDTALFSSETKFESGTGWPSFWKPLDAHNIEEHIDRDFGTVRTAISCRRCDAHLGHVFDDGPKPTGLRYCMNSAAMRFVKA
jgi:peptide-methionine (R)-S-oxide reductase